MQQHFLSCFVDFNSEAQFRCAILFVSTHFRKALVDICGVLCYGAQAERFESVSYTKVDHGPTRTMMEWKQHVGNSIIGSIFFISPPGNFLCPHCAVLWRLLLQITVLHKARVRSALSKVVVGFWGGGRLPEL